METVMTVELSSNEDKMKLEKCCFFIDLKLGLNVWLAIESLLWTFLAVSALYFEIFYIDEVDLLDFIEETEKWYFYLIFGDQFSYLDQHIRTYIILINFLLMLIFSTYLAFSLVLLYGINSKKTCCFIPYVVFDGIFIVLAICGCVGGFIASVGERITHLFRVSFVFLIIKVYIELCVISLLQELKEKKKSSDSSHTESESNIEDVSVTAV